jgi:hypothetical protein
MRIRVIQKPNVASIDGIELHTFRVGHRYEVGNILGALFLCEGWAEPVDDPPAPVTALRGPYLVPPRPGPSNLIRELWPPFERVSLKLVPDRRSKARRRGP